MTWNLFLIFMQISSSIFYRCGSCLLKLQEVDDLISLIAATLDVTSGLLYMWNTFSICWLKFLSLLTIKGMFYTTWCKKLSLSWLTYILYGCSKPVVFSLACPSCYTSPSAPWVSYPCFCASTVGLGSFSARNQTNQSINFLSGKSDLAQSCSSSMVIFLSLVSVNYWTPLYKVMYLRISYCWFRVVLIIAFNKLN